MLSAISGKRSALPWLLALALAAAVSGCGRLGGLPAFQPLTLDLERDMAPRDPAAGAFAGRDVYCITGKGTARLDGQWRPFRSTGFVLPGNGLMSSIRLEAARGGSGGVLRGYLDGPGQRMVFCPLKQGPAEAVVDCASLYVMEDDLTMAVKRTFDVPDAVQNAYISCAYRQEDVRPL